MNDEQPKRWWINLKHAHELSDTITWDEPKKQSGSNWIEVQEVPKAKRRKWCAFMQYEPGTECNIIKYFPENCPWALGTRLPSHDIEVDE